MGKHIGDKVARRKDSMKGEVVEGNIIERDHILWANGTRSDLQACIEKHLISFLKDK